MVIITETINDFFVGGGKMVTIVYLFKKKTARNLFAFMEKV